MKPAAFQRARKPAEKELRRQALLSAARRLLKEVGSVDISLSELARRAGISKPNIYRYFESREEILAQVWIEELRELRGNMEATFAKLRPGQLLASAKAVAGAFAAQPTLCELTSIMSPVLERNMSPTAIIAVKVTLAELAQEVGELLHGQFPALLAEDCHWAAAAIATYVAGSWPFANPQPNVAEALASPELKGWPAPDFAADLTRFIEVLFSGLSAKRR